MPKLLLKPAVLLITLILFACNSEPKVANSQFFVFGTVMDVSIRGVSDSTANRAFGALQMEFRRMHQDWHAWEPGELTRINDAFAAGRAIDASPDIITMIQSSQLIEQHSGGNFNPAIGALIRLWGFHTSDYPIEGPPPDQQHIDRILQQQPSSLDIRIDGSRLSSANPAVQLDFGGIAKGYAIDLACQTLRQIGIENAIVNAGGDLRAIGDHGDRPWRIAIRNPAGGIIASLETQADEAVFTSGVYERFRLDQQKRYPHILDPHSGWPVTELASVTVIAAKGILADAAATALIVAGAGKWQEIARSLELDQVLLIDESGTVFLTSKMNDRVDLLEGVERVILDSVGN